MPFRCDMIFEKGEKKGEKKFGKRRLRTLADRFKKHMPYHLCHLKLMLNESFFSVDYPNHTLVGRVSVNSLCQQGARKSMGESFQMTEKLTNHIFPLNGWALFLLTL